MCRMYRMFGDQIFTAKDVTSALPMTRGECAGMLHSLRNGGIVVISNGEKRGYYNRYSKNQKSSPWVFTPGFIEYMQSGGLEDMERVDVSVKT